MSTSPVAISVFRSELTRRPWGAHVDEWSTIAVVGGPDAGEWGYVVLGEGDYEDDHVDAVDPVLSFEELPESEQWSDEPAEYYEFLYEWSAS
jgi:hypothetical protein